MSKDLQAPESGRIYGGESAAERLARQRRGFMDAGLELFGTVGYRATTVRLLCRQAGLIDRYFYKNFGDTEDLLAAIYTESLDAIEAAVVAAIAGLPADGGLQAIADTALDAFFRAFENPRIARVCWLEVLGVSPRIDALYTARIQRFADLLMTIARPLLPGWSPDEEEVRVLGIALIGGISQSAQHWLLSGYRAPRATLVSANALLLRGLAGVLGQPAAAPGRG